MNISNSKLALCIAVFVLTVASGVILSSSGKPYGTLIFTVHKLIAVGTIIVVARNIYNLYQTVQFQLHFPVMMALTGLLFATLVVSGALLSIDIEIPEAVLRIHQVMPLMALAASTASFYMLLSTES